MEYWYNTVLFNTAKKLAKRIPDAWAGHGALKVFAQMDATPTANREAAMIQGRMGPTATIQHGELQPLPVPFIELTPRSREYILANGFPLFNHFMDDDVKIDNNLGMNNASGQPNPWAVGAKQDARDDVKAAGEVIWRLARKMGIKTKIQITAYPDMPNSAGALAQVWAMQNGQYIGGAPVENTQYKADEWHIEVSLGAHNSIEEIWASLAHEFGHIVQAEFYTHGASPLLKLQIEASFKKYQDEMKAKGVDDLSRLFWMRDNFLSNWFTMRVPPKARPGPGERTPQMRGRPFANLTKAKREYWLSLEEWFAEQVARHFTTSPPVLNVVDRFFAKLGKAMRDIYEAFKAKFGVPATADDFIAGWLDSRITEMPLVAAANEANNNALTEANERAMHSDGIRDYPRADPDASSVPGRRLISAVGETVKSRSMAAAADRFNGFYKMMLSVVQVAARNLHIQPLQRYVKLWQQKQLERAQMINVGVETMRAWRNIGKKQAERRGGYAR